MSTYCIYTPHSHSLAMFNRLPEISCRATVGPEAGHACNVSVLCDCRGIERLIDERMERRRR